MLNQLKSLDCCKISVGRIFSEFSIENVVSITLIFLKKFNSLRLLHKITFNCLVHVTFQQRILRSIRKKK